MPKKILLNSLSILFVNTSLALLSAALFVLNLKKNLACLLCHHTFPLFMSHSVGICLFCNRGCWTFIVCESSFLLSCGSPITSHVLLNILSSLLSGVPSSAGPSSGTTMNLHLVLLTLCLNFNVYTHIIVQHVIGFMFIT